MTRYEVFMGAPMILTLKRSWSEIWYIDYVTSADAEFEADSAVDMEFEEETYLHLK